jgi:hypothetical protein
MQKPPIGQLIKPPIGAGRRNREKLSRVTNREMAIKPPIGKWQLSHQ